MAEYTENGGDVNTAIKLYARSTAQLHGSSLGMFEKIDLDLDESEARRKARLLLRENKELIRRNINTSEYGKWLRDYSWITRKFKQRLENFPRNSMAYEVDRALSGGLRHIWKDTTNQSVEVINYLLGCLGHFDITPYNQFISFDSSGKAVRSILYDFDYLGFHEPFHECGHALYSMNNFLNLKGKHTLNLNSALDMLKLFFTEYKEAFIGAAGEDLKKACKLASEPQDKLLRDGLVRASRFAGFITLAILNREKYLEGKDDKPFIKPLTQLCEILIDGAIARKIV